MKHLFYTALMIGLLAVSCSTGEKTAADPNAKKYTSQEAKFSINMPSEPEVHKQSAGFTVAYGFLASSKADTTLTYLVNYSSIPRELLESPDSKDGLLFRVKSNAMANIGAVTTLVDKELSEYGSKAVYFEASGSLYHLAYKIFFVENRMYELGILSQGKPVNAAAMKAYVDSFEALK